MSWDVGGVVLTLVIGMYLTLYPERVPFRRFFYFNHFRMFRFLNLGPDAVGDGFIRLQGILLLICGICDVILLFS